MRVAAIDLRDPEHADAALDALIAAGATAVELEGDPPARALGLFAGEVPAGDWDVREAETVDWGSVWRASVRPFRVGPLVFVPGLDPPAVGDLSGSCMQPRIGLPGEHAPTGEVQAPHAWSDRACRARRERSRERRPQREASIALEIGAAFGSGLHPTTALCLERLVDRPPRGAVVDVGTGNGILAIAALRLGADRALAVDTDRAALRVAARNLAANGLSERIELAERVPDGARFDLVVANVLASVLVDEAPRLIRALAPAGEATLSGIGAHQVEAVTAAWRHLGARVLAVVERDSWCRIDLAAPW